VRARSEIVATLLLSAAVIGFLSLSHAQARLQPPLPAESSSRHQRHPAPTVGTSAVSHCEVAPLAHDGTLALAAAPQAAPSVPAPVALLASSAVTFTPSAPTYLRLRVLLL
jgi:hypothetical protein